MRKPIVIVGLVLVAAAFAALIVFDQSFGMVISGSVPAAGRFQSGQFQGPGNFSFQQGGVAFRDGQSTFGSTFSTMYYRFSAYLVAIGGVVVTSLGVLLKKRSEDEAIGSGEGGSNIPPGEAGAAPSKETAMPSSTERAEVFHTSPRQHVDTSNKDVVIRLDSVVKTYGGNGVATPALRGVSLEIFDGEFVAIVGPSGSGKSTMMNMIGALDKPTSGKVLIDGVDISKLSDKELAELRNRKIGLIFQSFNLIHRMNALQNVEFPLEARNVASKDRSQKALKALQTVGLGDKAKRVPSKLSGGEQQRVAVARALVTDPPILLGDEPTGNLDTKNTKSITDLLHHLNRTAGKTVVVITHNMEIANEADRIIQIRDGQIARDEYTSMGGAAQ